MVERFRASSPSPAPKANPFLEREEITFLTTGCTLLDCVIAGNSNGRGGWPFGRMVNVVGDKSTGKTLLAEEAFANLFMKKPDGSTLIPGQRGTTARRKPPLTLAMLGRLGWTRPRL